MVYLNVDLIVSRSIPQELNPIQPSKGLISSVTSSIASMVRQSGVPSLHNAIVS